MKLATEMNILRSRDIVVRHQYFRYLETILVIPKDSALSGFCCSVIITRLNGIRTTFRYIVGLMKQLYVYSSHFCVCAKNKSSIFSFFSNCCADCVVGKCFFCTISIYILKRLTYGR